LIYKVVEDLKDSIKEKKVVTPRTYRNSDFCHSYKAWVKRKTKYHKLKNQEDIFAVIDTIFKNAAEAMLESDGGVVMEGIGYFAFYVSPKKEKKEEKLIILTGYILYFLFWLLRH